MKSQNIPPIKSLLLLCLLSGALSLCAQTDRDMRFSDALNEIQLYDYSELFLNNLLRQGVPDKERVNVQLLDTLLKQDKMEQAQAIYKTFQPNTAGKIQADCAYGLYYYARNPQKAIEYLLPMLDYCIKNGQNPKDQRWEKSVNTLYALLQQQGRAKEIEKLMNWVQQGGETDPRAQAYSQCILRMDAIENAIKAEPTSLKQYNEAVQRINSNGTPEEKEKMNDLIGKANQIRSQMANQLIQQTPPQVADAYRNLGDLLKTDLTHYRNYLCFNGRRAGIKKNFLSRGTISADEVDKLKRNNQDDWMGNLVGTMLDLEDIMWGGQDIASASAAALSIRGYYLLGEYQEGLKIYKKFKGLFDGCEELLSKEDKLDVSPSTDAKIWKAYCELGLAREAAAKKDKKNASRYYKLAFKDLGSVLKTCPKHKDGPKNFSTFTELVKELSKLEPKLADTLQEEMEKLPRPAAANKQDEKLVTPLANENFANKRYAEVIEELSKILVEPESRFSPGFPELLNRLALAQVLNKDYFNSLALADLMAWSLPSSDFTIHALKTAGGIIWQEGYELTQPDPKAKPDAKIPQDKLQRSLALKDQAMDFYKLYLKVGVDDKDAATIARRIANEYYNRAKAFGDNVVNTEKDQVKKAKLKEEWMKLYDIPLAYYHFIIRNFGNREAEIGIAYNLAADCLIRQEKFAEAADMFDAFCKTQPEDKLQMLEAKENMAETLSHVGRDYQQADYDLRERAAEIVVAALPEEPVAPKLEDFEKAEDKTAADSAAVPAKKSPQQKFEEAKKLYDEAVAKRERMKEDIQSAKKEKEEHLAKAEEAKKLSLDYYARAIAALEDVDKWLQSGSEISKAVNDMKNKEKDPEAKKKIEDRLADVRKKSLRLMPWLQDGKGDKKKAIEAFNRYISTYSSRNEKSDNIPGYMMRVGMLYTEIGDDAKAQAVLSELSEKFKDTPEGRNAKFFLAKTLYNSKNYAKALEILNDIFMRPELLKNLTVSNIRWVAGELAKCDSKADEKAAASLSIRASELLLAKLQAPNYKEWVSSELANEFQLNEAARAKFHNQMEQKISMDIGNAAMIVGDWKKAEQAYSNVYRLDKKTGYFEPLFLSRAKAYSMLGQYEKERQDLQRITARAMTRSEFQPQPKYWLYNKVQTLIADSFLNEKDYDRAVAAYSLVAVPIIMKGVAPAPEAEGDDSPAYVERAIYQAAVLADQLNMKQDLTTYLSGYQKLYPKGKYIKEINNLAEKL